MSTSLMDDKAAIMNEYIEPINPGVATIDFAYLDSTHTQALY